MYWMSREAGFVVAVYLWDSIRAQVLKLNNFKGGNYFLPTSVGARKQEPRAAGRRVVFLRVFGEV